MADHQQFLAGNIRVDDGTGDEELRDSLRRFGWSPKFPALKDEHGVVLVGHRRLRIAAELKIDAVVDVLHIGDGAAADAERVKLALISNIGAKPMGRKDRQRIAQHLYGDREWTMERIADALGISQQQVSKDLAGLQLGSKPARPKGGRPKGNRKPAPRHDMARDIVRPLVEAGETVSRERLAAEHGLTRGAIQRAEIAERARQETLANPYIDPATLTPSARAKLEAATRQMQRRLQGEFESVVAERLAEALGDLILSRYGELKRLYEGVLNRRARGVMKADEYRLIASVLHPDSRNATSPDRLAKAFAAFQRHRLALVDETVEATPVPDFPRTREEWMARRRSVKAARPRRGAVQKQR